MITIEKADIYGWLYRRMLKEIGVDIELWYKETEINE